MNLIGENDELTVDNKKWNEFRRVWWNSLASLRVKFVTDLFLDGTCVND